MTALVGARCGVISLVQRNKLGSRIDPNNFVEAIGIYLLRESMKHVVIARRRIGGEIHEVLRCAISCLPSSQFRALAKTKNSRHRAASRNIGLRHELRHIPGAFARARPVPHCPPSSSQE